MTDQTLDRRRYLTTGAAVALTLAGYVEGSSGSDTVEESTGEDDSRGTARGAGKVSEDEPEEDAGFTVVYDPYEGVDWGNVTQHKSEFHNHVRIDFTTPAQVVDFYRGREECTLGRTVADEEIYTVYSVADKGDQPMKFPWSEFSELDSEWEDRDPEELGVVSFPAAESVITEHVTSLFTTIVDDEIDADTRYGVIEAILEREEFHEPKGLAVLAHPERYVESPDEWERYSEELESFSREDGFIGAEIFGRSDPVGDTNRPLWDNILTRYAPSRLFWGFGVDDYASVRIPESADVRWTTVLLDEDEFDPSDQEQSRQAAMQAFLDGRTFACARRPQRDEELQDEYPVPVPEVTEIHVDTRRITIDAEEYDRIRWISSGEVVGRENSITLTDDLVPYVRAELERRGEHNSFVCTQPWGLTAEDDESDD